MKKIKISIVGHMNANCGDGAILESAKYLFQTADKNVAIRADTLMPESHVKFLQRRTDMLSFLPGFLQRRIVFSLWKSALRKKFYKHYLSLAANADAVCLAGGGLIKYKYEFFWAGISALADACDKNKVPFYLNAVGVEGYDNRNLYCRILKQALAKAAGISVRDDLDTLQNKYGVPTKRSCLVGDPALFWPDANPDITANKKSKVIGIGVVRKAIFKRNNIALSGNQVVDFYKNLIRALVADGYDVALFTNGMRADYKTAVEIADALSGEIDLRIIERPLDPRQFLADISEFRAIIAGRLHANILSVSLGIPSVGLMWNDKLRLFYNIIGRPECLASPDKLGDPKFIADALKKSIKTGYDRKRIQQLKQAQREFINGIVRDAA